MYPIVYTVIILEAITVRIAPIVAGTVACVHLCASSLVGQAPVTARDYARAESRLPIHADSLVLRDQVQPNWIGGSNRFWYRVRTPRGAEFVYVDPEHGLRRAAFDPVRLARALGRATDSAFSPDTLPFQTLSWEEAGGRTAIVIPIGAKTWRCDLGRYRCDSTGRPEPRSPAEVWSPDSSRVAFLKGHDLWLRIAATGEERALTTDGAFRYDYATAPEGSTLFVTTQRLGLPVVPGVLWSPDSRRLLTYRLDQRGVGEFHLVQSAIREGHRPKLWSFAVPIPGDSVLPTAEWVVFDAVTGARTAVAAPPVLVSIESPIAFRQAWWDADGRTAYYVDFERGVQAYRFRAIDAATGQVRTLLEERGPTMVEPTLTLGNRPNIQVIAGGREVVWFSERDGWGQLYRFEVATGRLINRITQGPWVVRELLRVDEKAGRVWFTAGGREPGRDPYYRHLYSVGLDGTDLRLLSPEDAEHEVTLSPGGDWALDRYSRVDLAPTTVLRSLDGKTVLPLERADVSRLLATGWRYPERFVTRAADGATDVYGILLRPSNFDSTHSYPVVEEIYPGPQAIKVPRAFVAGGDHQAIVELGFVGVEVDGRGTPYRSKAWHDYSYRHLENGGGLEDHVAAYRQLGPRYPFLDLGRVGIYGHSGGGFASTRAILLYPDLYKVAVSSSGNHDQRGYVALWGETYFGLPVDSSWNAQANGSLAGRLQGKLMLAFGDMDDNVPPALTIQVIDALTKANKNYDLLIVPNGHHGMMASPYFIRRRWDYLVRNLLGVEPPEYQVTTAPRMPFEK